MWYRTWLRGAWALFAVLALTFGSGSFSADAAPPAPADPISVVKAFYDAYNAGQIDKALEYVADDANFINPTGSYRPGSTVNSSSREPSPKAHSQQVC